MHATMSKCRVFTCQGNARDKHTTPPPPTWSENIQFVHNDTSVNVTRVQTSLFSHPGWAAALPSCTSMLLGCGNRIHFVWFFLLSPPPHTHTLSHPISPSPFYSIFSSNYGDCKGCCWDDDGCCDGGCNCGLMGCQRGPRPFGIDCRRDYCRAGSKGIPDCTDWSIVTKSAWSNVQEGVICRGNYNIASAATAPTAEGCKAACLTSGM